MMINEGGNLNTTFCTILNKRCPAQADLDRIAKNCSKIFFRWKASTWYIHGYRSQGAV